MIKNIKFVKNMAVYKDFDWAKTVRDNGRNIISFKKINIFYGRNYSGKTTISRIFRAFETGELSNKYHNAEFAIELDNGTLVSHRDLTNHTQTIKVFNDDFVKENLRFIINPDESIKSFAILGSDNNKLEAEINELLVELGSVEEGSGYLGALNAQQVKLNAVVSAVQGNQTSLDAKLSDKANKAGSGIKHNKVYGHATYNVPKLKEDILTVFRSDYVPITDDEADRLKTLLKEEAKAISDEVQSLNLQLHSLANKTQSLVEKKISISRPIQDLLDDVLLQAWVRTGRPYHEGKREKCGFCGNSLPPDLFSKLDGHFNQESEALRADIEVLISDIKKEATRVPDLFTFARSGFYASFANDITALEVDFNACLKNYLNGLNELVDVLQARLENIFSPLVYLDVKDNSVELENIRLGYNLIVQKCNGMTATLSKIQQEARTKLRLRDVHTFVHDIKYSEVMAEIDALKENETKEKERCDEIRAKIKDINDKITGLKAKLRDESKGAELVNYYLNSFFGHKSLSLKAVESGGSYRFEVIRDGAKAHHLSEGECSLVAFCYFVAKLNDVEINGDEVIVWIDDPISSLDVNHIFFVYSLINRRIANEAKIKQIFIATHNLDFLRYLKRLPGAISSKNSNYFLIERGLAGTTISTMPDYLKNYITEFNYLFHQIYKCANADLSSDVEHDCYYNFGNNARKFLEAFLYYKFPNADKDEIKLSRFFGEDHLGALLIDRVSNEYSHLEGNIERSTLPIDVPEMRTTAQYILNKIKENDEAQYNALLESIGQNVNAGQEVQTEHSTVAEDPSSALNGRQS